MLLDFSVQKNNSCLWYSQLPNCMCSTNLYMFAYGFSAQESEHIQNTSAVSTAMEWFQGVERELLTLYYPMI